MISKNGPATVPHPWFTDYFRLPVTNLKKCPIGVVKINWTKS
jgi:hypothetical protein